MFLVSRASYWIWLGKQCVKLQAASSIWFVTVESSARWLWYLIDVDPDSQGCLLQPRALALERELNLYFRYSIKLGPGSFSLFVLVFPHLSYHALNLIPNFLECGIAVPIVG